MYGTELSLCLIAVQENLAGTELQFYSACHSFLCLGPVSDDVIAMEIDAAAHWVTCPSPSPCPTPEHMPALRQRWSLVRQRKESEALLFPESTHHPQS